MSAIKLGEVKKLDNTMYYYTYDAENKVIVPKFLEGGKKSDFPEDTIIGLEFLAPDKTVAEYSANNYNKSLVNNITKLETAEDNAMFIETCKDCGRVFVINKKEYMWFKDKGYNPPKRCKSCRDKRKKENAAKEKQGE